MSPPTNVYWVWPFHSNGLHEYWVVYARLGSVVAKCTTQAAAIAAARLLNG
jgi:hypothetical protein